jgi:type IV pilus assembly protein PilM
MGREELEARMKDELGQYIPYNLDEVNVSYEILETGEESPSRTDVLLVAAKKESVDQFLNLLDPIGMEPAVIDVDFFALSNAYEATYGNGGERVALLDIGASKTDLNVFFAGVPAFTRDLTMGGYQITSRLETRFGLSFEEAERVKLGDFTGGIDQDDVHHIFNEVTESWVEEVQRIVNFYYSNYSENKIDKILLSGGSSRIPGLARVFESALEIPTDIFNPLMRLDFDSKRIDKSYLEYVGPQMAIALGLGLRRLEDK